MGQCPKLHVDSVDRGNGKLQELFRQDGVIVGSMISMCGRACSGTHEMKHYWHASFRLGKKLEDLKLSRQLEHTTYFLELIKRQQEQALHRGSAGHCCGCCQLNHRVANTQFGQL